MSIVWLLLLMFDADFFLMLKFISGVQKCILNFIVPFIEKYTKKIFTVIYIRKIPTYNIRCKI